MCQWLITCVLRCANELNQLLMKELSISRLGQRWCSLPSTSHPHPLHPVSLSYLDLRCLTSSPRSCFILVGDCYVEQKTYILTFIFCHFFIIMNSFPSFTHLLCRLDLICCSLPSSLPLRVRTRHWHNVSAAGASHVTVGDWIRQLIVSPSRCTQWWWNGGESLRQTVVFCAFKGAFVFLCVCACCRGLLGITCHLVCVSVCMCLYVVANVFVRQGD